MQPHLFHLLRPLVSKHTIIRDALARARAGDIPAFENVLSMVEAVVKDGILDYHQYPEKYDELADPQPMSEKEQAEQATKDESSQAMVKACRRPWWVCQPYVRPLPKEALEKGSLTLSKKERDSQDKVRNGRDDVKGEVESRREEVDEADGVPREEMAGQSQVCG